MNHDRGMTCGPFGVQWGWLAVAAVALLLTVLSIWMLCLLARGSSLQCEKAKRGGSCTVYSANHETSFSLDDVAGASVVKQHQSSSCWIHFTFQDGRDQKTLASGRVVQYRLGSATRSRAEALAGRFRSFLARPAS